MSRVEGSNVHAGRAPRIPRSQNELQSPGAPLAAAATGPCPSQANALRNTAFAPDRRKELPGSCVDAALLEHRMEPLQDDSISAVDVGSQFYDSYCELAAKVAAAQASTRDHQLGVAWLGKVGLVLSGVTSTDRPDWSPAGVDPGSATNEGNVRLPSVGVGAVGAFADSFPLQAPDIIASASIGLPVMPAGDRHD